MSTAELNRARERVLALARQIEDLSHPETAEEVYYPEFLKRLLSAVGAPAGIVWIKNQEGKVGPRCEQGLDAIGFRTAPQVDQLNAALLTEVFEKGQSTMFGGGERTDKPTPTNHLYVLYPILYAKDTYGVVEVLQRPDTDPRARPGYLQFVEQMCGFVSRYVQMREEGSREAPPNEFWIEFNRFAIDLQRSLDVREVAATAANDGRHLIRCDRVSVAVFHGTQLRMRAISGQESVNRKANAVRLLEKLASKVVPTHEPLMYIGKIENLPPQIEEPLADYIQESGARCVIVIPLFLSEPLIEREPDKKMGKKPVVKRKVVGAYIVELITDSRPKAGVIDRLNLVSEHVATAISNAQTHQNLFLLPLWRSLGRFADSLRGRTLYKFLFGVFVLLAFAISLVLVKWDYRVEGKGRLMPVIKHEVFALEQGQVEPREDGDKSKGVLVKGGETVKEGELLVVLRNDELDAKLKQVEGEISEYDQTYKTLENQRNELQKSQAPDADVQRAKISGEIAAAGVKLNLARMKKKLLDSQLENLNVRAPSAGVVATFHVDQLLENRPVQRGEVLLEIMDPTGDWRLELDVPDYRLGHVLRAQEKIKKDLDVEFVLATDTETKHHGVLEIISTRAVPSEGEGSVVEMFVKLDAKTLEKLGELRRIGADVRAKINCGKQPLGYVLFGDVVEFIQNKLWF